VFYLNADESLVSAENHHQAACVGYATTPDFIQMDWGHDRQFNVLNASASHWANTAIWSGDVIRIGNGFLMFYTSRDRDHDNGLIQNIGVAYAPTLGPDAWRITPIRIQPGDCYQLNNTLGKLSSHAWRDPFLFRHDGQVYMLLSAMSTDEPAGRNGVVGLLRLNHNDLAKADWIYLNPPAKPGIYAEMEVPQLYQTAQGHYELVFSSWAKNNLSPETKDFCGFQGFTSPIWPQFHGYPHVLLPETEGLYACRVIPELGGEIIGFDIQTGGIRRSGVQTGLQAVNRSFLDLQFALEASTLPAISHPLTVDQTESLTDIEPAPSLSHSGFY
jgi:hypothetical protein